jgi:Domain of unknown function (DUF4349)
MRPSLIAIVVCVLGSCGAGYGGAARAVAPGPVAPAAGAAAPIQTAEQLVIEGTVSVQVGEIADVVPAVRALVEAAGGRVVNEAVRGAETSWTAELKVRVPPAKLDELIALLAARGEIVDKRITATDVSKQLFDQELALTNLRTTLARLTQLMAQGGLKMTEILQVEQELTRLRGQIEQIEGEQRFLKDRVALATLDIALSRRAGATSLAQAKLYPGARAAALVLLDPGGKPRVRLGGGVVMHPVLRVNSLEIDLFEQATNADGTRTSSAVIATTGGAAYSDFLGHGQRAWGNPYLGGRLGYGYLDGSHRFVVQGEFGVELYKQRFVVVDANVRITGLIGQTTDLGLVFGGGATFAF